MRQVPAWEGGAGRPGSGRHSSAVPVAHHRCKGQTPVHRVPGDPGDKGRTVTLLNRQEASSAKGHLPSLECGRTLPATVSKYSRGSKEFCPHHAWGWPSEDAANCGSFIDPIVMNSGCHSTATPAVWSVLF